MSVPEAYVFFNAYQTERPAFLVMDADGRRVTSIALKGATPGRVVRALEKAVSAEAVERLFLKMDDELDEDVSSLVEALGAMENVKSVDEEIDGIAVFVKPGSMSPEALMPLVKKHKLHLTLTQPVMVTVTAKEGTDAAAALKSVPGVWYVSSGDAPKVWINRFLIHPKRLAAAGLSSDAESFRYRFKAFPADSRAIQHLVAPFEHRGVVAVIPHVDLSALEVIALKETFERQPLEEAYTQAGLEVRR